jgi:hypothetical protein
MKTAAQDTIFVPANPEQDCELRLLSSERE